MEDILNIGSLKVHENIFDNGKYTWDVPTLIEYCKDKGYKVFDLPVEAIPLSTKPFEVNNIKDYLYHSQRVEETELKYPIILDDTGYICDGWHRVIKAILRGDRYIKAIRILEMPAPSSINESK